MSDDAAIQEVQKFIDGQSIDQDRPDWKARLPKPPSVAFTDGKKYTWSLSTNKGDMKFELHPDVAPMHASSTIFLTLIGFYDNLSFHRVIGGFMAQGGCPHGTGTGGPGYRYDGEFSPSLRHTQRGLLSMANAGPGTDGSQFFITFTATPHLDDNHTIFGTIVDGEATLDALEGCRSSSGRTTEELMILKATIGVE